MSDSNVPAKQNVNHTPGPWWVGPQMQEPHGVYSVPILAGERGVEVRWGVAKVGLINPDDAAVQTANARLIAAAPEMLAAIREALLQIDDGPADCAGTRQDGTRVWKGSFLRRIEALRAAADKADPA